MPLAEYSKTIEAIFDATLDERRVPTALRMVAEYVGAVGANYLIVNKLTQRVSSAAWWGIFTGSRTEYLVHYSELDRYRVISEAAPSGSLVRLSERLPQSLLRHDEWYNDFLLRGGVCDLLGTKLHESPSHMVLLSLHRAVGDSRPVPRDMEALQWLMPTLSNAARLHVGLIDIGYQSAVERGGLDHPVPAVIFADKDGRIVETNQVAERVLRLGDGLTIHNGKICARRNFETAKLAELIARATAATGNPPSAGCLLIGRDGDRPAYIVRVAPVTAGLVGYDLPMAMILICAPEENRVSESELAELYGLSPAESRLAIAIAFGKRLGQIAGELGVQITTLRTQLSSILRKCEVERQSDLVRLISNISVVRLAPGENEVV